MFQNIPPAVMDVLPAIGIMFLFTTFALQFIQCYRSKVMVAGLQLGGPNKNQKKMNVILGVGIGIFLIAFIVATAVLTFALRAS